MTHVIDTGRYRLAAAVCLVAGLAVLFGMVPSTFAREEEMEFDRPIEELFQTDVVYTQNRGEWQLTLLPSYRRGDDGRTFSLLCEAEYGITGSFEVGAEWNALVHHWPKEGDSAETGIGDVELTTKYNFLNIGHSFHAGLAFDLGLPVGDPDRALGEGTLEYSPSLLMAWEIPKSRRFIVFSQTGLAFMQQVRSGDEDAESAAHEYFISGGALLRVEPVVFSLECSWRDNTWNSDGTEKTLSLTPGLHWKPEEHWQIGIGVTVGLNHDADKYDVGLILAREF